MGYTTDFEGRFELDRPLLPEHAAYLKAFSETRRMKRDATIAETLPDPIRAAVSLPIGVDAEHFVGGGGFMGQEQDASLVDFNFTPAEQPGLWCQWTPTEDGTAIVWDGGEKFSRYVSWLSYILNHFLIPWGYRLNGKVTWQGESPARRGNDHRGRQCGGRDRKQALMATYRIIRHFQDSDVRNQVVKRALTLAEAQEHCKDPETSSKTATSLRARSRTEQLGPWFDGFEEERS